MIKTPIIVALDFPTAEQALDFTQYLNPELCRVKVGFELFLVGGPGLLDKLHSMGYEIFLDLKFHDIPNTVAAACRAAAAMGVWMINVHASGGQNMMLAAREAVDGAAHQPKLIAVTILTSMQEADLQQIGLPVSPATQVNHLAMLAKQSGMDGVVCSPQEVAGLRKNNGDDFLLITPGIRIKGNETSGDDQSRTLDPQSALQAGSNYLVIGRPITRANDPLKVLTEISVS